MSFSIPTEAIITKRLAQAYLICAGSGDAAEEAARDFARAIFCIEGTGCGVCPGCRKFDSGNHTDHFEVGGESSINKNAIAELPYFLSVKPLEGGYRVITINNAHNMNLVVQNRLLKSFEDPPENTVFILTSDTPSKLLPTVLSRCIRVNISPEKQQKLPQNEKMQIALAMCGGFTEQALALYEDKDFFAARESALSVCKRILSGKIPVFTLAADILKHSGKLTDCLYIMSAFFADAAAYKLAALPPRYTPDAMEDIRSCSLNAAVLSRLSESVLSYLETDSSNPGVPDRLIIETMFFELAEIARKNKK